MPSPRSGRVSVRAAGANGNRVGGTLPWLPWSSSSVASVASEDVSDFPINEVNDLAVAVAVAVAVALAVEVALDTFRS